MKRNTAGLNSNFMKAYLLFQCPRCLGKGFVITGGRWRNPLRREPCFCQKSKQNSKNETQKDLYPKFWNQ